MIGNQAIRAKGQDILGGIPGTFFETEIAGNLDALARHDVAVWPNSGCPYTMTTPL